MQTKTLPGFSRYVFREDGQIVSTMTGKPRVIRGHPMPKGYMRMCLRTDEGGKIAKFRSNLICEAFHGPRPPGMQCRHIDGNPKNDRPENLAWGTQSENQMDRHRHGTAQIEARNKKVRLNRDAVFYIRNNPAVSPTVLGRELGVDADTVRDVWTGRTWRWLK
jgi:hypothetical protein